jgi:hypothetical protein
LEFIYIKEEVGKGLGVVCAASILFNIVFGEENLSGKNIEGFKGESINSSYRDYNFGNFKFFVLIFDSYRKIIGDSDNEIIFSSLGS